MTVRRDGTIPAENTEETGVRKIAKLEHLNKAYPRISNLAVVLCLARLVDLHGSNHVYHVCTRLFLFQVTVDMILSFRRLSLQRGLKIEELLGE